MATPAEPTVENLAVTSQASITLTPVLTATVTPDIPLAASVNQQGISLVEFEAELNRYQQAAGRELNEADRQLVLDDLINQELLAQAGEAAGFSLDEATLQQRIDDLASQLGGEGVLQAWMQTYGYASGEFRFQLARAARAAWMRDQIIAQVPLTADQVHAQQILTRSADEANRALERLQAGRNFADLAKEADPVTNGELGWFPRGILFYPELDEAVFSLQPGEHTPVIKTLSGYHILYLIERDPQHPLDPQARLILQEQALQRWLAEQRLQSAIEILIP
jgi:parvulin-like peptidyl-prolyl isomerase